MYFWNTVGRIGFALGLFAAAATSAAVIYKWTDASGVVHYTDQPTPGAEKIVTSGIASAGISAGPSHSMGAPPRAAAPGQDYARISIESPNAEQVFFNDDSVPVRLVLEPGLKPNQAIVWRLNGKQLTDQSPDATSFTLSSLPRGSYTLAATVSDRDSGASQGSSSVTFYFRQPSELSPQHKRP